MPLKLAFGVYVNEPSRLSTKLPLAGLLTSAAVSGSPSASVSLANTLSLTGESSLVLKLSSLATGAWLTWPTAMVTVARPESALPSLAT